MRALSLDDPMERFREDLRAAARSGAFGNAVLCVPYPPPRDVAVRMLLSAAFGQLGAQPQSGTA